MKGAGRAITEPAGSWHGKSRRIDEEPAADRDVLMRIVSGAGEGVADAVGIGTMRGRGSGTGLVRGRNVEGAARLQRDNRVELPASQPAACQAVIVEEQPAFAKRQI